MKKQEKILCSENTRYIMTSTTSQTSGITFICLVPEQLITSPLKRLSLQMAKTGEGDFTTRMHEGGSREICELSNSFNSMVKHIYKLIRKTYVAELNAKDGLSCMRLSAQTH